MSQTSTQLVRFLLALLGLFWPLSCPAGGEPPGEMTIEAPVTPEFPWVRLHYAAKGAAGGVSIWLDLARSSPSDLGKATDTVTENTTPDFITAAQVLRLDVHARAESLLSDHRSEVSIWFDANSGAVLKRDKLRPGNKGYQKLYRFAADGAFRIKRQPLTRKEAEEKPENWTRIKRSFYPYDSESPGCQVVSEPTLLLYLISRRHFDNGGAAEPVCVFLDDSLYRVRIEPQHGEPLEISYTVNSGGNERTATGKQETIKLSLRVEPLSEGSDSADFELLELRGDIVIYVAKESGIPLQLSGGRAGLGRVNVRLEEAIITAGIGQDRHSE